MTSIDEKASRLDCWKEKWGDTLAKVIAVAAIAAMAYVPYHYLLETKTIQDTVIVETGVYQVYDFDAIPMTTLGKIEVDKYDGCILIKDGMDELREGIRLKSLTIEYNFFESCEEVDSFELYE